MILTDFVVREYNGAWGVFRREDVEGMPSVITDDLLAYPIEYGLTYDEALKAADFHENTFNHC